MYLLLRAFFVLIPITFCFTSTATDQLPDALASASDFAPSQEDAHEIYRQIDKDGTTPHTLSEEHFEDLLNRHPLHLYAVGLQNGSAEEYYWQSLELPSVWRHPGDEVGSGGPYYQILILARVVARMKSRIANQNGPRSKINVLDPYLEQTTAKILAEAINDSRTKEDWHQWIDNRARILAQLHPQYLSSRQPEERASALFEFLNGDSEVIDLKRLRALTIAFCQVSEQDESGDVRRSTLEAIYRGAARAFSDHFHNTIRSGQDSFKEQSRKQSKFIAGLKEVVSENFGAKENAMVAGGIIGGFVSLGLTIAALSFKEDVSEFASLCYKLGGGLIGGGVSGFVSMVLFGWIHLGKHTKELAKGLFNEDLPPNSFAEGGRVIALLDRTEGFGHAECASAIQGHVLPQEGA